MYWDRSIKPWRNWYQNVTSCCPCYYRHGHTKVVLRTVDTDIIVSPFPNAKSISINQSSGWSFVCWETLSCYTCSYNYNLNKHWFCKAKCFTFFHALPRCATTLAFAGKGKRLHGTHGTYSHKVHQHFQPFLGANLIRYYVWRNQMICGVILLMLHTLIKQDKNYLLKGQDL